MTYYLSLVDRGSGGSPRYLAALTDGRRDLLLTAASPAWLLQYIRRRLQDDRPEVRAEHGSPTAIMFPHAVIGQVRHVPEMDRANWLLSVLAAHLERYRGRSVPARINHWLAAQPISAVVAAPVMHVEVLASPAPFRAEGVGDAIARACPPPGPGPPPLVAA